MDSQVNRLVEKAWSRYQQTPPDRRLLIGIAGIPGSGKTTLAKIITQQLNSHAQTLSQSSPSPAILLPMDGFHLPRSALSLLPDPENAHFRRGAAFTFDAPKFLSLIQSLRAPVALLPNANANTQTPAAAAAILAPSFDHAVKDPREGDIEILPSHRIVVAEGLYLALDQETWRDAAVLFDELWFVEVEFDVARRRLARRHIKAGIVRTLEEGDRRARLNDLVNGEEILRCMLRVDELVKSREDEGWVHI